jgi:hypothetical protein
LRKKEKQKAPAKEKTTPKPSSDEGSAEITGGDDAPDQDDEAYVDG